MKFIANKPCLTCYRKYYIKIYFQKSYKIEIFFLFDIIIYPMQQPYDQKNNLVELKELLIS